MKKFNVGVLGIGDISDVYINNLKKYDIVNVLACASRGTEKAKAKAEQHAIPRPYAGIKELLGDSDIDIILNLTLPAVHAELNMAAIEAGKHVYTEKPLASNFEEGKAMLDLAGEKGLYIGCAPDTFLGGRLQTCRKLFDQGIIGEAIGVCAFMVCHGHEWHHPNPEFLYVPGGGPLLDMGPYYMTALLSLFGPVKRCCAVTKRSFDTRTVEFGPRRGEQIDVEVDTHISGNLEFENGAVGTIVTSYDVWDSELPRIEIYGTKGTICINDSDPLDGPNLFGGPVLLRIGETSRWTGFPRKTPCSEWEEVPVEHQFNSVSHKKNSRGIGLVDMAYAIREGREERASGKMSLHSLEVMEGLLTSGKEERFSRMTTTFNRPEPRPVDFP